MTTETTTENVWLEFRLGQHMLGDQFVTEGQEVEVQLRDETWVRGEFYKRPGSKRRANLRVPMAGSVHEAVLQLPDFAVLARWPEKSEAA